MPNIQVKSRIPGPSLNISKDSMLFQLLQNKFEILYDPAATELCLQC